MKMQKMLLPVLTTGLILGLTGCRPGTGTDTIKTAGRTNISSGQAGPPGAVPAARTESVSKFPAFPPEEVTSVMDMQQMQEQLGALPPELCPHVDDPNRPQQITPTHPSMKFWTDTEGYTPQSPAGYQVKRSQWGEWTNFTEKEEALGGYSPLDPLRCEDGRYVNGRRDWEKYRRPEIWQHVQHDMWGVVPKTAAGLKVSWQSETSQPEDYLLADGRTVRYVKKQMTGKVDSSFYPEIRHRPEIQTVLYQPTADWATPAVIQLGRGVDRFPDDVCLQECFSRGWGYLVFDCAKLQPDQGQYLTDYLIGLLNKGHWRQPEDWGAMAAWSWGISRIMDRLAKDSSVDIAKIAVTGHSRYGKTALVAMAYEPRLSTAYVSCSGVLGAAPIRTNWGENLEVIASEGSYHWAAGNIFKWVGPLHDGTDGSQPTYMPRRRELLRVDAHLLMALAAPRPVFVNAGTTDAWANPMGMYTTCRDASPVWQLYGCPGLIMQDRLPLPDKAYIEGNIGFRLHSGGHNDRQDWPAFAAFAEKYWGRR